MFARQVQSTKDRLGYWRALHQFYRRRDHERAVELAGPGYTALTPLPATRPRTRDLGRAPHVVVVPYEGSAFDSWRPGTRNFYWEAAQNLREDLGDASVSVFDVDPGTPPAVWHTRLIDYLRDSDATHVITHIEADPGSNADAWTWDTAFDLMLRHWDGVLLGVMFDSAYDWIAAKGRLLARMSDRYMLVDICEPMDGRMALLRPEVGPVNMPVSRQAMTIVDERLAGISPQWDVSFIGVMYPYRMALVEQLRALGMSVVVNPHREDRAANNETTRVNQPGWPDYMAGLRSSRMTINFSQSNAPSKHEQLKTRVIEATLAGTLLLTDDADRTRRFWVEGQEYAYFATPADLPRVAQRYLDDPALLVKVAAAGQRKARELAPTHFWSGIERGLQRRDLPSVGFPTT